MAKMNDDKIVAAVLTLAAKGWDKVSVAAVAKAVKITPAQLAARFVTPVDFIPLIIASVSRRADAGELAGSTHDRLFDLIMARFDVMQKNRAAHIVLADAARRDRDLACALSRAVYEMITEIVDTAITAPVLPRTIVSAGLTGIYAWTFAAWKRDDSRDMGKTMAALDRGLRLAERAVAMAKPKL